ncbi:MAG TPA: hypothetical protein VG389_10670 [Myxococcota bacterium]|nr:hypothetical protein [Myxococcota bacterium]
MTAGWALAATLLWLGGGPSASGPASGALSAGARGKPAGRSPRTAPSAGAAGTLTVGLAGEGEGARRVFAPGGGAGRPGGARLTIAELSGDRVGNAGFAGGRMVLELAWRARPGVRLEARLPVAAGALWLEARDPPTDAHVATERRTSLGLGDATAAVIVTPAESPDGMVALGMWVSAPTSRPRALVPADDGLLEAGPLARGAVQLGRLALAAEVVWRVRGGGFADRLAARALAGATLAGGRLALAAGLRADLPLGRGRVDVPAPALAAGDGASPDPTAALTSTAATRARVDATAGAVVDLDGAMRAGMELAAALWGRDVAVGFGGRLFVERSFR